MNREIKFRAWNEDHMVYSDNITTEDVYFQFDNGTLKAYYIGDEYDLEAGGMVPTSHEIETPVMQFTGLKDKNVNNTCIYEGDIVSLLGILIGNKYENEDLLKDPTNLLIEGFGTATWRVTEKEAMDRGCHYSE